MIFDLENEDEDDVNDEDKEADEIRLALSKENMRAKPILKEDFID